MPTVSWESHFAQLFADYIAAANEGATGIPAALLKRTTDAGLIADSSPRPRLVFSCGLAEPPHKKMRCPIVRIDLLTKLAGDDRTAPELAKTWMQAVREYLDDADAWHAFILSLEESRRTGWRIMKQWTAEPEESLDHEQRTCDYRQPVHLRVAVA